MIQSAVIQLPFILHPYPPQKDAASKVYYVYGSTLILIRNQFIG